MARCAGRVSFRCCLALGVLMRAAWCAAALLPRVRNVMTTHPGIRPTAQAPRGARSVASRPRGGGQPGIRIGCATRARAAGPADASERPSYEARSALCAGPCAATGVGRFTRRPAPDGRRVPRRAPATFRECCVMKSCPDEFCRKAGVRRISSCYVRPVPTPRCRGRCLRSLRRNARAREAADRVLSGPIATPRTVAMSPCTRVNFSHTQG